MSSVDVSGLQQGIRDLALRSMSCIADTYVQTAQGNAPHKGGELADGVQIIAGPSDTGSSTTATVASTARAADGTDYGVIQNTGIPDPPILPVNKKALWWEGLGHPVAKSQGPAGTHWWDRTVESWGSIVGSCG